MDFADYELFINDDFELAVYNRDIDSVVVDVHERRAVLEHFRDRLDAELGQRRVDDLDGKALALVDALVDALDTARDRDR